MHHLKNAILAVIRSTIMIDCDKGLMAVEEVLGPAIF